jgi:hypothetical protein
VVYLPALPPMFQSSPKLPKTALQPMHCFWTTRGTNRMLRSANRLVDTTKSGRPVLRNKPRRP